MKEQLALFTFLDDPYKPNLAWRLSGDSLSCEGPSMDTVLFHLDTTDSGDLCLFSCRTVLVPILEAV